jgi:hypothetical protein
VDECGVTAFGAVRASLSEIAALRRRPGSPVSEPLPANLLKHADEQTVAGVAAVLRAVHDFGLQERSFADWGVLGAPRFPGRLCVVEAVDRFLREGPLGVSPHIIPQRSTHSLSGTVSLAFGMRGPNFGVGGGEGAALEGLLAALAFLVDTPPPGLWLVLTEWDPEPVSNGPGSEGAVCHAAALALVPAPAGGAPLCLRLVPALQAGFSVPAACPPTVSSLVDFLIGPAGGAWAWVLEGGDVLELTAAPCPSAARSQGTLVGAKP